MLFGPKKFLKCPGCATVVVTAQVRSAYMAAHEIWSDGFSYQDAFLETPSITRCSQCRSFFWIHRAEQTETPESTRKFWLWPKRVRRLTGKEFLDAANSGVAESEEEEIHLRMRAWWEGNEKYRQRLAKDLNRERSGKPRSGARPNFELSPEMVGNLESLLRLIPDIDDPNAILTRAEIFRQLGRMQEAQSLLTENLSKPHPEVVEQMQAWIREGERGIRLLEFKENDSSSFEEAVARSRARRNSVRFNPEEAEAVRARVIDRGLAAAENVDAVIYQMDLKSFKELTKDFPSVSRIDFHPVKPPKPPEPESFGWRIIRVLFSIVFGSR